jgi:putative Mg2+ transporter-C (MgtC) family protein
MTAFDQILQKVAADLRLELLLQLSLATILGGAIGLERELRGKPAGLRTNVLICVGSTLFTVLSVHVAGPLGDPGRIAAQVLTGVGFIGAGTILHTRGAVSGLTSAATIWVVTAIGMALGSSAYVEAVGATLLVAVVLTGLGGVERWLEKRSMRARLVIRTSPEPGAVEALEALVRATGVEVERTRCHRENTDLVIELDLAGPGRAVASARNVVIYHPVVRAVSTGE